MFRYLRVKRRPDQVVSDLGSLSSDWLNRGPGVPITLRQINNLPGNAKNRIYRALVPPSLLTPYHINPITWQGPDGDERVRLKANPESSSVQISIKATAEAPDDFFVLELQDTSLNAINLNFLLLSDPDTPRFATDRDELGHPTLFGTVHRNLAAEEKAMQAGLAPAQVRKGLGASKLVLQQLEAFLATCAHAAFFLEPLTYASAWLFERRGFAYVSGHSLMDDIHREFQPGGQLYQALDGSSPFRQPDQWRTVRGRAWAIHDGILEVMGAHWDGLRMVKQVGRHAGAETFPGAAY